MWCLAGLAPGCSITSATAVTDSIESLYAPAITAPSGSAATTPTIKQRLVPLPDHPALDPIEKGRARWATRHEAGLEAHLPSRSRGASPMADDPGPPHPRRLERPQRRVQPNHQTDQPGRLRIRNLINNQRYILSHIAVA